MGFTQFRLAYKSSAILPHKLLKHHRYFQSVLKDSSAHQTHPAPRWERKPGTVITKTQESRAISDAINPYATQSLPSPPRPARQRSPGPAVLGSGGAEGSNRQSAVRLPPARTVTVQDARRRAGVIQARAARRVGAERSARGSAHGGGEGGAPRRATAPARRAQLGGRGCRGYGEARPGLGAPPAMGGGRRARSKESAGRRPPPPRAAPRRRRSAPSARPPLGRRARPSLRHRVPAPGGSKERGPGRPLRSAPGTCRPPPAAPHLPHGAVGARAHGGEVLVTLRHLPHRLVQLLPVEAAALGHFSGAAAGKGSSSGGRPSAGAGSGERGGHGRRRREEGP